MTSPTPPQVLIVGAGAIGAFFGAVLARSGASVSVVSRSDGDAVRQRGFRIQSPILGSTTFRPTAVFRNVVEASAPDYLILSTKVLPDLDRAGLIRPAVSPNTVIVLLQNGLDIEAAVAEHFPRNELLSCIAFIGVARTPAGEIHHQAAGSLTLGSYPRGSSPAAQRLAALFEQGGVKCRLVEDIQTARWQKTVWNAAFNPLSILGSTLDTATLLHDADSEQLVRELMREVMKVATADGHPLPPNLVDQLIASTRAMPPYKTSMALDFEAHRPIEIEAILGNAIRTAHRLAIEVPRLEMLYTLARAVERARAQTVVDEKKPPANPTARALG
jgi:2-dehydropantoate 2-reductase